MSVVCLLTDFGTKDSYVGVMKGVLLKSKPEVSIVDITHDVPPQDIRAGAFHLRNAYRNFPPNTLFIAVVDPGVGTARKIIYAEAGGQKFLAPDNGLLSWVFDQDPPERVLSIPLSASPEKNISQTFHGRDVLAPVAGRILKGEDPGQFGTAVSTWETLSFPVVKKTGSLWQGEILYADVFGNLVTNLIAVDVIDYSKAAKLWIEWEVAGKSASIRGLVKSYSDVEKGKLLAIVGSAGFIEISVREGNAAHVTGLKAGSPLSLYFRV